VACCVYTAIPGAERVNTCWALSLLYTHAIYYVPAAAFALCTRSCRINAASHSPKTSIRIAYLSFQSTLVQDFRLLCDWQHESTENAVARNKGPLKSISSVSVSLNHGTAFTPLKRTLAPWGVSSLCWDVQIFRNNTDLLSYGTLNILSNYYLHYTISLAWYYCTAKLVGLFSVFTWCQFCMINFSLFLYFPGVTL